MSPCATAVPLQARRINQLAVQHLRGLLERRDCGGAQGHMVLDAHPGPNPNPNLSPRLNPYPNPNPNPNPNPGPNPNPNPGPNPNPNPNLMQVLERLDEAEASVLAAGEQLCGTPANQLPIGRGWPRLAGSGRVWARAT